MNSLKRREFVTAADRLSLIALSSQKYRCMLCLLSPCVGHLSNLGNFENTHEARVALMVLKGLLTSERLMCNANS